MEIDDLETHRVLVSEEELCVAGLVQYGFAEDGAASVNSVKENGWQVWTETSSC